MAPDVLSHPEDLAVQVALMAGPATINLGLLADWHVHAQLDPAGAAVALGMAEPSYRTTAQEAVWTEMARWACLWAAGDPEAEQTVAERLGRERLGVRHLPERHKGDWCHWIGTMYAAGPHRLPIGEFIERLDPSWPDPAVAFARTCAFAGSFTTPVIAPDGRTVAAWLHPDPADAALQAALGYLVDIGVPPPARHLVMALARPVVSGSRWREPSRFTQETVGVGRTRGEPLWTFWHNAREAARAIVERDGMVEVAPPGGRCAPGFMPG